MDERCELTELKKTECDHCLNRPGSIDLNPPPGASAQGSGYAHEVVGTVYANGDAFGLVPSGGSAYAFGSGHGLHHRRECSYGVDTPDERVLLIDDPAGDLWQVVAEPRSEVAAGRAVMNLEGRPLTVVCDICALRPRVS